MKGFNSKTFLMCLTVFLITNSIVAQRFISQQEIIDDLPTDQDFQFYLNVLEKAVAFCEHYERHIDMNLQFGLFMVDVNLRHFIEKDILPISLTNRLKNIIAKIDGFKAYISAAMHHKDLPELEILMTKIFQNTSDWLRPNKFTTDLLNVTIDSSMEQLEKVYGNFDTYYYKVFDFPIYKPSPEESDACILQLLKKGLIRTWANCVAPADCRNLLNEGSEYGYGLTHRMLFLIVARFYRRCVVFGEAEDKTKMDIFCKQAFNEAQYIAGNFFELIDLMVEQMALCGVMGHAQFFRNYWLKTMVEFQTEDGCFYQRLRNDNNTDENEPSPLDTSGELLKRKCQLHFTSVAVAALANVLRYIGETGGFHLL